MKDEVRYGSAILWGEANPLSAVRDLVRAVRPVTSRDQVAACLRTCALKAVGPGPADATVWLVEPDERMRPWPAPAAPGQSRRWAEARRQVQRTGETLTLAGGPGSTARSLIPVAMNDSVWGILEVAGSLDAISRAIPAMELAAAITGEALAGAADDQANARRYERGVSWTAHEIVGELAGVSAALDEAIHGIDAPEPRRLARRALDNMTGLMMDAELILGWATGQAPLRKQPTDLVRLVQEAAPAEWPEGIEMIVVVPARVNARIDRAVFRLAVANILRNAFNHARTTVEVSVTSSNTQVQIRIVDDGEGVRSDLGGGQGLGHGMGLIIARCAVEAHGGRLDLEPSDRGACFVIRLPRRGLGRAPAKAPR